jgi:hypothetical protein
MSLGAFSRGLQASVRNNYTAYGYSVMITASYGVLTSQESTPKLGYIFLFLAGAIAAFVGIELAISKGFQRAPRGEPSKVVAIGAAFSLGSVGAGVGAAALSAVVLSGLATWPVGGLAASGTYVLMSGVEIAVAELMERNGGS